MIALGPGCMEIKKKGESDSGASGNASDSSPKKTIPPGKTSSGGALPASVPLFQGIFALILLLSLLLGYGLPYQPPKLEKHDYPEFPKDVSPEQRTKATDAWSEKNEESSRQFKKALKAWNDGGDISRRKFIAAGRNVAKFSTVLWFTYCLITLCFMPLARAIPKHFGKDLSVTIMPVLLLGFIYALAKLILDWIPAGGWPMPNVLELRDQSLWKVLGQFIVHLTHPLANMVVTLKEFAVDKWFVPLLFVAATLVIGWGKVPTGKVDKS